VPLEKRLKKIWETPGVLSCQATLRFPFLSDAIWTSDERPESPERLSYACPPTRGGNKHAFLRLVYRVETKEKGNHDEGVSIVIIGQGLCAVDSAR